MSTDKSTTYAPCPPGYVEHFNSVEGNLYPNGPPSGAHLDEMTSRYARADALGRVSFLEEYPWMATPAFQERVVALQEEWERAERAQEDIAAEKERKRQIRELSQSDVHSGPEPPETVTLEKNHPAGVRLEACGEQPILLSLEETMGLSRGSARINFDAIDPRVLPGDPPDPDPVNHPAHYKRGGLECIDVIEAVGWNFHIANCVKYLFRMGHKGDASTMLEDAKKARWYLDRWIQKLEKEGAA